MKTMWGKWNIFNEVTSALHNLASTPSSVDDQFKLLEHFIVLFHECTSTKENMNEVRKLLFSQKGRLMDGLPPTQAALVQHKETCPPGNTCLSTYVRRCSKAVPSTGEWEWMQMNNIGWKVVDSTTRGFSSLA